MVFLRALVLILLMACPALAQDGLIDQAYQAFDEGDDEGAAALLDAAEVQADSAGALWQVDKARAALAHLAGDDVRAIALLEPLMDRGEALFGPDSPELIPPLRMLGASYSWMDRAAEGSRMALRAARIARASGDLAWILPTLSDLARDRIDADDPSAAALIGAELVIFDSADDGSLGPWGQEGAALWALALLRQGHPDAALARLLPLLRLPVEELVEDVPDLIALFDDEAGMDDEAVSAWADRAMVIEEERQAADLALLDALAPLALAFDADDPVGADATGRLALAEVPLDDPIVASSYYALALMTANNDRPDLAATWALRLAGMPAAYLASLANDPLPVLERNADWLLNQGRVVEGVALSEAIAALAPLRDGPGAEVVVFALARLGTAYRDAGRGAEAAAVFQQALTAIGDAPEGNAARLAVQVWVDLALLARDRGEFDAAEAAYASARALLDSTDAGAEAQGWAYVLAEERGFLIAQGREAEALALAERALMEVDARRPDPALRLTTLRDLAESRLDAGDLPGAEAALAEVLAGLEAFSTDDPLRARITALQVALLTAQGRGEEAGAVLQQVSGGTGNLLALVGVIEAATVAQDAGDTATALLLVTSALDTLPPDHPMLAYLQAGRAAVLAGAGDDAAALEDLRQATAALTPADRRDEPMARDHLSLHVTLARRFSDAAEGVEALNLMTEAFQVAQRVDDLDAGAALARATARLQGDGPEAAALARRLDEATAVLEAAKAGFYARLSEGGDAEAEQVAVTAARESLAAANAELSADFPNYAALVNPKTVDLLTAAALLGPDEALVLFASADPAGAGPNAVGSVFAITSDTYVTADLPPRAQLAALTRDLRCAAALTDRACGLGASGTRGAFSLEAEEKGPFDYDLARLGYLALMGPVAEALEGKTSLILVPDRTLSALPFALLLTADTPPDTPLTEAPWLIRQSAITILPTVASLAALRGAPETAAQKPFLGIGDPLIGVQAARALPYDCGLLPDDRLMAAALTPVLRDGVTTLAALPETRCELARAAALFGPPEALVLQGEATEAGLRAMSDAGELEDFRVIAFATHALLAGEMGAQDAGLVLTPSDGDDGLLTPAEIARLRLDADFVILSACNTAAGSADEGEGLAGLASAFFLAGTRSLLVSHWPVYSDAATRLTSGMVAALADEPAMSRAEALRRAMLAVLDDPAADARQQHPAYWAPFLIAGDAG